MIVPSNVTAQYATKGDLICRDSHWTDVARFFLINYVLHAFTVITEPGSGVIVTLCNFFVAILMPYANIAITLTDMFNFAILKGKNHLQRATLSDALCMIVPRAKFSGGYFFSPRLFNIHGQYPLVEDQSFMSLPKWKFESAYEYRKVPANFTVHPIVGGNAGNELSSNHSVLKSLAAIVQIIYGSYGLYEASGGQFMEFGYAAYALTAIPYIIMSFVNLAASLSRPSYPSKYIVYYRGKEAPDEIPKAASEPVTTDAGPLLESDMVREHREQWMCEVESKIGGAVGYAYGDFENSKVGSAALGGAVFIIVGLLILGLIVLPYLVIKRLTGFDKGRSTLGQRLSVIGCLAFNQVSWSFRDSIDRGVIRQIFPGFKNLEASLRNVVIALILSGPTVGCFVVVAQMILQDQVCVKM